MNQYVVIGLGHFGMLVARALSEKGIQVLAIDKNEKKTEVASEFATKALQLDATDEEALKSVGFEGINVAVVSVGNNIASSIMITLLLKELGVPRVIAKATSDLQGRVLQRVGATKIVYPEKETAGRLVESLIEPGIFEYIKLSPKHTIAEVDVPSSFTNKTIGELAIGTKHGIQIIAIKRRISQTQKNGKVAFSEEVLIAPSAQDGLLEGDKIIVLGTNKNMEKIKWMSKGSSG